MGGMDWIDVISMAALPAAFTVSMCITADRNQFVWTANRRLVLSMKQFVRHAHIWIFLSC